MERVAFLVDPTGEHVSCLLNPETLVVTRTSGVQPRRIAGGRVSGTGLADDPLLLTGGGRTEFRLDLLFDVDLVEPANQRPGDVRELTRPLWQLAENSVQRDGRRQQPTVRFVWGRAWNVAGVVTEVAERFERFTPTGVPLRSWLRMAFLRTGLAADEAAAEREAGVPPAPAVDLGGDPVGSVAPVGEEQLDPAAAQPISPVQLGLMSTAAFGSPLLWKELLAYNGVDDPLAVTGSLAVPPTGGRPA